jgi:hypothetical protein
MGNKNISDIFYDCRDALVSSGTGIIIPMTRMFDNQIAKIESVSVCNLTSAASKADLAIYRGVGYDKVETIILTTIGDIYIFNWSGYIKHPMFIALEFTDCTLADRVSVIVHGLLLE